MHEILLRSMRTITFDQLCYSGGDVTWLFECTKNKGLGDK